MFCFPWGGCPLHVGHLTQCSNSEVALFIHFEVTSNPSGRILPMKLAEETENSRKLIFFSMLSIFLLRKNKRCDVRLLLLFWQLFLAQTKQKKTPRVRSLTIKRGLSIVTGHLDLMARGST